MSRAASERGSVLVLALCVLLFAYLVVAVVTGRATQAAQAAVRAERQVVAFNAAEAGLQEAVQRLAVGDDPADVATELERATIEVEAEWGDDRGGWRDLTLTSTGACRGVERTVRLTLRVRPTIEGGARVVGWAELPPAER
jgi:hypothetical protein